MDLAKENKVTSINNAIDEFKKSNEKNERSRSSRKSRKESKFILSLSSRPKWLWILVLLIFTCSVLGAIVLSIIIALYNPQKEFISDYPLNSTIGRPCRSSQDCILNAYCNIKTSSSIGICTCLTTHYIDTATSTCLRRNTINQNCSFSYECLEYKKLVCVSNKCQCDTSIMYWNSTVFECQPLKVPYTICTTTGANTECIANSVCWPTPSVSLVNKCICGWVWNWNFWWYNPYKGVCESKKKAGTICEYDHECVNSAYCTKTPSSPSAKVCVCDEQYYVNTNGDCALKQTTLNSGCSLIDQCNLNQNNLRCISSQCRCDLIAEIYDTFQSKCVPLKTYGQTCTVTTDCVTGFTCVLPARGGTRKACLCSSTQYFDWISGTCQTLKAFNSICGSRYECVNHDTMVCMASSGGVTKRCICAPNYSYQSSTTCLLKKSMSSSCTDDIECQDHLGFVCSGSICTCPTTKRYDSVLKKCLPLRRRNQACSANSECSSGCCSCSITNACD